jgi:replicative DNA helicase
MIIIDYLQLCDMTTGQNNRNREQEVAQATRKAKLLAKELNVPVVLLSQLNRVSEGRPAGRPELSQLRESGAIEQDAELRTHFSAASWEDMKRGAAPVSPAPGRAGARQTFNIHHIRPVAQGGGVYDLDNLVIITPRAHIDLHRKEKQ